MNHFLPIFLTLTLTLIGIPQDLSVLDAEGWKARVGVGVGVRIRVRVTEGMY